MDNRVLVAAAEDSEPVSLMCSAEGHLPIDSLNIIFPGAKGLKYRSDRYTTIVSKIDDVLYPPKNGWGKTVYYCLFDEDSTQRAANNSGGTVTPIQADSKWVNQNIRLVGLAGDTTNETLRSYFSKFGNVLQALVKIDPISKKCEGHGYVRFASQEEQARVLRQGHTINGRRIYIAVCDDEDLSSLSDPSITSRGKKRKALTTMTKTEEMRHTLDEFIENEIPAHHQYQASRVAGRVVCWTSSMEFDFEEETKKREKMLDPINQRSLIEMLESNYLEKDTEVDISGIPRQERWRKILDIDCEVIKSLKDKIEAEPFLSVKDFPRSIELAYDHYNNLILHRFMKEKKLVFDEKVGLFMEKSAKKAIRLLRAHFYAT